MLVTTTRFGAVEVADAALFTFADGLPGFPHRRRFAILEAERFAPFRWLHSLEDPGLAFLVIDPLLVKPDYRAEVTPEEAASIGLQAAESGFVLVILTVPDHPREMTANLKAPLVFNPGPRLARQFILLGADHPIRHRVFSAAATGPVVPEPA